MSAGRTYRWLHRVWYDDGRFGWLLLPLSAVYGFVSGCRRLCYRIGLFRTRYVSVPVVVVGNLTAGGTGKTPIVVWLANELRARAYSPGIVSRGYGGKNTDSPTRVGT